MRSLSITTRVIAAYTFVFGLLLAVFGVVIYRSSANEETATLDARLVQYAASIQAETGEEPGEGSPIDAAKLRSVPAGGLTGVHVQLYGPDGTPLIPDALLRARTSPDRSDASGSRPRQMMITVHDTTYRILQTPMEIEDRDRYTLEVAASMMEAHDRLSRLRLLLVTAIPASLLLAALAAYLITRTSLRPIAAMTETARSVRASSLGQRIPVPGAHDEVRELAETLNSMLERIDAALQSQTQFVADASHELRTPLTVLTTELEYAEHRVPEEARESIRIALAEVGRLTQLTDGLLLLARLDAPHMTLACEPVALDELIDECIHHLSSAATRKHVTLRMARHGPVTIDGDPVRLKSVFLNLLDNGIAYSGEGTTVTASVHDGEPDQQWVTVSIEDEGCGIADEDLSLIFQRFYRTPAARSDERGSGLGLAIAERIARLHGGKIEVESTMGKGSVFTVFLPRPSDV